MSASFARCNRVTRVYEGGYVDHPEDPGGPTNFGITQRVYDADRKLRGEAVRPVRLITQEEVDSIYREQYWERIHGDELPAGVDMMVYDTCVNSGANRAWKLLQASINAIYKGEPLAVDGSFGKLTLAALDAVASSRGGALQLIEQYGARRLGFLKQLDGWSTFGKGWSRRVTDVTRVSRTMVVGGTQSATPALGLADIGGNATASDATVNTPSVTQGQAVSGASVGASGAGLVDVTQQMAGHVQGFIDYSNILKYAFIALTIASIAAMAWAWYVDRRSAKALAGQATAGV